MRTTGAVARLWPLVGAVVLGAILAGCGHDVTPTAGFDEPGEIPRPEDLQAASFHTSVAVSWFSEPSIFAFVDGWNVYRATGEEIPLPADYARINPRIVQSNDYRDENVVDGTRYWYVVTAVSPAGIESRPTDPASVRVDATPPDPPAGIQATARFNPILTRWEVVVGWQESAAEDVHHYNLYREPSFSLFPFVPDLFEPLWVDDQVAPEGSYSYWVTAVDGTLNESAAADTVEVVIPAAAVGSTVR